MSGFPRFLWEITLLLVKQYEMSSEIRRQINECSSQLAEQQRGIGRSAALLDVGGPVRAARTVIWVPKILVRKLGRYSR